MVYIGMKIAQKEGGLTVALFESLSDWEPCTTAPFDACPPANNKANKENINIMIQLKFTPSLKIQIVTDSNDNFTCYK